MSRSANSLKNIYVSVIMIFINIVLGFLCQKLFVNQLGTVNLGLNGLFSNIVSFLSIADLGIGSAIVFNMYKPIAEKNKEKIKSLMNFYKKSYNIIACIIFILGFLISFFLPYIIGKNNLNVIDANINVYVIFYLFLMDVVFSYLLTYKRSMLYANQKNYVINGYHTVCLIIMYVLQMILLLVLKNFYVFLIIKIICRVIENILINIRVNKEYAFLNEKNIKKLDNRTNKDIYQRIRASIFHNIGGYIVLSTDNLIISSFIGIEIVGIYSNYLLIINALNSCINQIFNSITASVGNLLVEKDYEKNKKMCNNFLWINFVIYTIVICMLYGGIQTFIEIWLGKEYLISNTVIIIVLINFYFQGMRQTMQVFAQAGGICYENRFVPLFEAILNIVFSILLVKYFGLAGVFMGTIISSFVVHFYSYPKYIYKLLLKRKAAEYIVNFVKKLILFLILFILCILVVKNINIYNIYMELLVKLLLCGIIPSIILYLMYKESEEFYYYKKLLLNIFNRKN